MKNIYDMTLDNLILYFDKINQKPFKANQVFDWIYKKKVTNFDDMTNIKKEILDILKKDFYFNNIEIKQIQEDKDVKKYLFELEDEKLIEAVLMFHDYGNSLCISTQVGCNMGCTFCESGRLKKQRNLKTSEMVNQIMKIEEIEKTRISHVVLMGIGEPFDNYDNVIDFINIINSGKGLDIGARHITVSTSGIIPKIKEFIKDGKQVNLAVSLHAPNDELRSRIMPVNKAYKLDELMSTLKEYINITNRRVTFEYVMLNGVNDTDENAKELANLVRGMNCYINLIPYNETSNIIYKKSNNVLRFYDLLKKEKINVTIRKEFGSKVSAACGQLRSNYKGEK